MNLYYVQTNLICLFILLIIYVTLRNRNGTLPARRIAFNNLLLTAAIVCVSDIFAWVFNGKESSAAGVILHISNIVNFAAITWSGYLWVNYVELRITDLSSIYRYKSRRLINAIPLVIMLILLVTNPFTKLLFTIDESNNYTRANGIIIHWIVSWFYLIYATGEVIARVRRSKTRVEKEQFTPMLWFIVPPVVAAILQMFLFGLTTTQCGMTLAALIIAINFMVDEGSKDTLTGLNNRRALEISISERLQKSNTNLTVLMCDIDNFKSINDTLGHTTGDIVLKRMAGALKKACADENRDVFLCRYGGDEFVICSSDTDQDQIAAFISKLEKCIEAINSENRDDIAPAFGISVGEATGVCMNYADAEALISAADARMYEVKNAKRVLR